MRETVTVTASAALPVMHSANVSASDVIVHASVLALVEAYTKSADRAMPWASLLAAATAVPSNDALLRIGAGYGRRVSVMVSDAVSDLMGLGLLETGTTGLHITDEGCAVVRRWNGEYTPRLEAAERLLAEAQILPTLR